MILILAVLTLSITSYGTTWFPSKHTCPICKTKGTFQDIASYGSYIYQWSSKYQYIFWPLTDDPSVYSCLHCHYSTYMWDFDSVPPMKIDTIKQYLSTVRLDKKYSDYLNIPMTTRLEIAQNIYNLLSETPVFWCKFYRVMGYHYENAKISDKAAESRNKSLELAKQILVAPENIGQEKETLLIIAAMYKFTNRSDSAMANLIIASQLTYKNKQMKSENEKNLDDYLSELIKQYIDQIKKEQEKIPTTAANIGIYKMPG